VEDSDEDLLDRYKSGETDALTLLVERYRRQLFSFILRMSSSAADADEIFQEVWLRVIRKAGSYRRDCFRGWVYRIAHNLLIDHSRRRKMTVVPTMPGDDMPQGLWVDRIPARERSPSDAAQGNEMQVVIGQALSQLSAEQREVFLMRVEGDISFREIARVQGVPINTALARMHYAVCRLRKLLHEERKTMEK
jgi:RNA polymerase sigma-70 factor (ECF subfamily)